MYYPLGLVVFVAVEGTFVCFTEGPGSLYLKYYRLVLLWCHTETCHDTNSDIRNGNVNRNSETANVDSAAITSKMALHFK